MIFSEKYFSCFLLIEYISSFDCLYALRFLAICVLQLFVSQIVTSQIFKSTLTFLSRCFPKNSGQKFKYLKNKQTFFIILKEVSVAKIASDLRVDL